MIGARGNVGAAGGEGRDGGLADSFRRAVAEALGPAGGRVGVAFSGGVDSSALAAVCSGMGHDVTLLTVGFAGSHDMRFAAGAAGRAGLPHASLEIGGPGAPPFEEAARIARKAAGTDDPSWNENCIAFIYVAALASRLGLGTVAAANGIDELFCGYDAYRREMERGGGPGEIRRMVGEKVAAEIRMMAAVDAAVAGTGVRIARPLLSPGFVEFASALPLSGKIRGAGDALRKHAVREMARSAGVPEDSAGRRKKAMQYGTGIHKALARLRRAGGA